MLSEQVKDIQLSITSEPRPIGEVIIDLIREGLILPNYKSQDYGKEDR